MRETRPSGSEGRGTEQPVLLTPIPSPSPVPPRRGPFLATFLATLCPLTRSTRQQAAQLFRCIQLFEILYCGPFFLETSHAKAGEAFGPWKLCPFCEVATQLHEHF
jgi:hypothetical protein